MAAVPITAAPAQAGTEDGPVTRRTYDAEYIQRRLRLRPALKDSIKEQFPVDGPRLIEFIEKPEQFVSPSERVPTDEALSRLKRIVDGGPREGAFQGLTFSGAAESYGTRESMYLFVIADVVIARTKAELVGSTMRIARGWFASDTLLPKLFAHTNEVLSISTDAVEQIVVVRAAARRDLDTLPIKLWQTARRFCDSGGGCGPEAQRNASLDAMRVMAQVVRAFGRRASPVAAFAQSGSIADADFKTREGRIASRFVATTAGEVEPGGGARFARALQSQSHLPFAAVFVSHAVLTPSDTDLTSKLPGMLSAITSTATTFSTLRAEFESLRELRTATADTRRERYGEIAETFIREVATTMRTVKALVPSAVDSTTSSKAAAVLQLAADMTGAMGREDYLTAVTNGMLAYRAITSKPLPIQVTRWMTFAGDLGGARTAPELRTVLERFALPPASYYAKRYPDSATTSGLRSAVHLNAYLGGVAGVERVKRGERESESKAGNTLGGVWGFSLPVGLEFGLGNGRGSLFFPLIDLGVIATYRFLDDQTETAPNVTFANVIAPGAFYTLSLGKNVPLAFEVGVQYAPRLRNLTSGERRDATRLVLGIATDIPLVRFR